MCPICIIVKQLACNWALLIDKSLNCFLLGDPNSTLSLRIARARDAGSKSAKFACAVLTAVWHLFGADVDHCTWSEMPGSIGAEVWHWSKKPTEIDG